MNEVPSVRERFHLPTAHGSPNRRHLFGMPFDLYTRETAADEVIRLAAKSPSLVVTPNIDHFLRHRESPDFRRIYATAAISVLDGMPLVWAARLQGETQAERVTGVDLVNLVAEKCSDAGVSFAIVGGSEQSARSAAENLKEQFPGIPNIFAWSPSSEELVSREYVEGIAAVLSAHGPVVVALCLGSPKQEVFFEGMRIRLAHGVCLGVGATVDFLAGEVKRAPLFLQNLGLEWAYRLGQEPRRLWRRYALGAFKFAPYFVLSVLKGMGRKIG